MSKLNANDSKKRHNERATRTRIEFIYFEKKKKKKQFSLPAHSLHTENYIGFDQIKSNVWKIALKANEATAVAAVTAKNDSIVHTRLILAGKQLGYESFCAVLFALYPRVRLMANEFNTHAALAETSSNKTVVCAPSCYVRRSGRIQTQCTWLRWFNA